MPQSKSARLRARNLESLLVTTAFACGALGFLLGLDYLGYIGFVLGIASLWIGFQKQTGHTGQLWYRVFAVIAIIVSSVDISATYFSR
jgi:hypothetical protein